MNIRIVWTFTTTNPLPEKGFVKIVFKDPLKLSVGVGNKCTFKTTIKHTCEVTVPPGVDKVLLF